MTLAEALAIAASIALRGISAGLTEAARQTSALTERDRARAAFYRESARKADKFRAEIEAARALDAEVYGA